MIKKSVWLRGAVLLCGGLFLGGCAGLFSNAVEKGGQVLDGTAFAEKTLSRYQGRTREAGGVEVREVVDKQGDVSLVIRLEDFPAIRFRGSDPLGDGNFYLTRLDYLGGNVSGWNEFALELSGTGTFAASEETAILTLAAMPEPVQISSGKIRRNETRITGAEALTSLRNRYERILALTEWMRGREGVPVMAGRDAFKAYWQPVLLPETVSKKKRPPAWDGEGARWVRAEDRRWNAASTEILFPEELWPLRNSGALLRDWEEALEWIYFEYSWEKIGISFSGEISIELFRNLSF
jgi:hypothetical protein